MWDLIVSVPDHCFSFYFDLYVYATYNRHSYESFQNTSILFK